MTKEELIKGQGITCLSCGSVLFSIKSLIEHKQLDKNCKYFKFGDGKGVLFVKLFEEER